MLQSPNNLQELPSDVVIVEQNFPSARWDDATWILTSAFIIFTMQSGFGLLESGSVSQKNEVHIMFKNAVDVLFGGLSYWMFGYGLSFGTDAGANSFFGIGDFFVDSPKNDTDDDLGRLFSHFVFHCSFATTATTIVSGAMVERTKPESYIIFSFINTFVYCLPAHWLWAKNGWLKQLGAVDIAGAGTVHLVGGVTGLVATLMLKPRYGRFTKDEQPSKMSSPTNTIFGMFMLCNFMGILFWIHMSLYLLLEISTECSVLDQLQSWAVPLTKEKWGWLGFNCGSTYGITDTKWILAARSATATITASIAGGITGITLSYIMKKRKFYVVFLINGVLGSLVAITAMCALARPWQGVIIGAVGALIACLVGPLCEKLKIDDPVGVVPVHGMASIWSLIAVGIFGENDELSGEFIKHDGLIAGGRQGFKLLGIQILAALVIATWTATTAFITLKLLDITVGLRVPLHEEMLGADLVEHSLNGTFDKKTSEWRDREGQLIMVVKKHGNEPSPELLARVNSQSIVCTRCECVGTGSLRQRRSAFGFTRSEDTMPHASEASNVMHGVTDHDEDNWEDDIHNSPEHDRSSIKRNPLNHDGSVFRKLSRTFSNGLPKWSSVHVIGPRNSLNGATNMANVKV